MVLLIDNYDSFSYNLYQYIGEIVEDILVYKNDEISISDIKKLNPSHIILSPGPGRPKDAGILEDILVEIHDIPILGVYDFEFAQVCKGGIDISMVNDNLSLKKDKNVFAMGEVLDVDAICGGYNLMFAFASAIEVFKEIKNEIQNK